MVSGGNGQENAELSRQIYATMNNNGQEMSPSGTADRLLYRTLQTVQVGGRVAGLDGLTGTSLRV